MDRLAQIRVPDGATLTFSTAGDEDARICAADESGAIDATEPCDLISRLYARVAVELALRGELREAAAASKRPTALPLPSTAARPTCWLRINSRWPSS